MKSIKILGSGCAKCRQLADNAVAAADELGIEYQLDKVTQINDIMAFGVMMTPGLVVDGQVKSSGKVLSRDAIKTLLSE